MQPTSVLIKPALFALCLGVTLIVTAQPPPNSNDEKIPPERFEAKVLKVFAAKDGAAIFRAYVVKWKDQEVIVSDTLANSGYKEGDTIAVLAMNHRNPKGSQSHRLLGFTILPQP